MEHVHVRMWATMSRFDAPAVHRPLWYAAYIGVSLALVERRGMGGRQVGRAEAWERARARGSLIYVSGFGRDERVDLIWMEMSRIASCAIGRARF